jgi:glycosyltransferase involved in cell wall biosynthesis
MRVLVASTVVPGTSGGASLIVDSLERALRARDHEVDVLRFPFYSDPNVMLEQMLALRLHHVEEHGDRLVCIRTPSYLLRHPAKVLWFIHHHRGAYDLWGTPHGDIPDSSRGRAVRAAIRDADELAFDEARAIYTNSQEVSDRLMTYNGRSSEVLYPPLDDPGSFRCDEYGDSIVYVSRLTGHKRQALAIEAMRHVTTGVQLIVAGAPDRPEDEQLLRSLISMWELEDKVELRAGWISEDEKIELLARALAAVYVPFDEDSYGYASLEAHQSGKAVVSTIDSGGVRELVVDGCNGFLAESTPPALAACFDRLYDDRQLAERMGIAGRKRIAELGIDWDHVISRLLR